jgi:PKD repeat protein
MKNLSYIIIFLLLITYSACQDSTDLDKKFPPEAVFIYSPTNVDTSTVVTFDASLSTDEDDPITVLRFRWDFEGDQNWTDVSASTNASHRYLAPGTYEAGLRVIDSEGWSHEMTQTIIVLDSLN